MGPARAGDRLSLAMRAGARGREKHEVIERGGGGQRERSRGSWSGLGFGGKRAGLARRCWAGLGVRLKRPAGLRGGWADARPSWVGLSSASNSLSFNYFKENPYLEEMPRGIAVEFGQEINFLRLAKMSLIQVKWK